MFGHLLLTSLPVSAMAFTSKWVWPLASDPTTLLVFRASSLRSTWKETQRASSNSPSGSRANKQVTTSLFQPLFISFFLLINFIQLGHKMMAEKCITVFYRKGQKEESWGGGGGGRCSARWGKGRTFAGSCRGEWQWLGWQQWRWEVKPYLLLLAIQSFVQKII